jgi:hypothetical protein
MTPNEWIANGQVGISSKTIWCVMMGVSCGRPDIPYDPDDFSRCYKLLELFPGWKGRMQEVADKYPKWIPLVKNWDYMTELYEMEKTRKDRRMPELWNLMSGLRHACYMADGWTGGNGSYKRGNPND